MNVFTVVGRLTRDSELRFTAEPNSKPVLGFTVASDVGWGDNKRTLYVSCSLWRSPEGLHPYLKKGTQVVVNGTADLRLWERGEKNGAEITLNCNEVTMVGGKGAVATEEKPKQSGFRDNPVTHADFDDDDIPF